MPTAIFITFLLSPSHLPNFSPSVFSDLDSPEYVEGRIPPSNFDLCPLTSHGDSLIARELSHRENARQHPGFHN